MGQKFAIAVLAFCAAVNPAAAQPGRPAQPSEPAVAAFDLSKFDCRTLLKMQGDDRDDALLFLHGYVSGAKGQKVIELDAVATATDKIIDYCISHPDENALSVFTKFR